ncbi:MAG: hypothetical protein AAGK78_07225 [Planctomycetota bacterium]
MTSPDSLGPPPTKRPRGPVRVLSTTDRARSQLIRRATELAEQGRLLRLADYLPLRRWLRPRAQRRNSR